MKTTVLRLSDLVDVYQKKIQGAESEEMIEVIVNEIEDLMQNTIPYDVCEDPDSEACLLAQSELDIQHDLEWLISMKLHELSVRSGAQRFERMTGVKIDDTIPNIFKERDSFLGVTIGAWAQYWMTRSVQDDDNHDETIDMLERVFSITAKYLEVTDTSHRIRPDIYYHVKLKRIGNKDEVFLYRDLEKSPRNKPK